jgi:hypothetical protein
MHSVAKIVWESSQITFFNMKYFNSESLNRNKRFLAKNIESRGSKSVFIAYFTKFMINRFSLFLL